MSLDIRFEVLQQHHDEMIEGYKELLKATEAERDYWFNKYLEEIKSCTASQRSYWESSQAAQLSTLTQQEH